MWFRIHWLYALKKDKIPILPGAQGLAWFNPFGIVIFVGYL